MAVMIPVTEKLCKEDSGVIILSYISKKKKVTYAQVQKEMEEKYNIPKEKVSAFFEEAIQSGMLSPRVGYYKFQPGI